ncbi:MAG: hypothetical protein H7Y86_15085 [Rhizobacter sp.]|nr:hypothetical protein [Ferruginibacter sp.]
MMYPTAGSTLGMTATAAQLNVTDPKLVLPVCIAPSGCNSTNASKVMRLSAASPAINAGAGIYSFITTDNELQVRTGLKDIGADEYSNISPVIVGLSALSAVDVGPDAVTQSYSCILTGTLPLNIISFNAKKLNGVTQPGKKMK